MAPSRFSFSRSSLTPEQLQQSLRADAESMESDKSAHTPSPAPTTRNRPSDKKKAMASEPQEDDKSPPSDAKSQTMKQAPSAPESFVSRAPPGALPEKRKKGLAYKFIVLKTEQQKAKKTKKRAAEAHSGSMKRKRSAIGEVDEAARNSPAKRRLVRKGSEERLSAMVAMTETQQDAKLDEAEKMVSGRMDGTKKVQVIKPQKKNKKREEVDVDDDGETAQVSQTI